MEKRAMLSLGTDANVSPKNRVILDRVKIYGWTII